MSFLDAAPSTAPSNVTNDGQMCSVCYNEITTCTGRTVLACSHYFHLKCISTWLSNNTSCPCCRRDVSSDFEDLTTLNTQQVQGQALDEAFDLFEDTEEEENDDFGGLIMLTLEGLRELGKYYFENSKDRGQGTDNLVMFDSLLTQDFFNHFCRGAPVAVRRDSYTAATETVEYSHCFIRYYSTYLFFLGIFKKEDKNSFFWDLWERIRLRQEWTRPSDIYNTEINNPSQNAAFIRSAIQDHMIIQNSAQTSFLYYLINPQQEREINHIMTISAVVTDREEIIFV